MFVLRNCFLITLFTLCFAISAFAQVDVLTPDTTRVPIILQDTSRIKTVKTRYKRSPARAALLSAALPGTGQAYNRRYWKMPIVYGGVAAFAYFIWDNNRNLTEFNKALALTTIQGQTYTGTNALVLRNPENPEFLLRGRDLFRRNLEATVLMSAGFYLLNIADAMIDAHLLEFNIIDDISMNVKPAVIPDGRGSMAGGLTLRVNLR
jgi:hypothetical protein